jgi:hypothetical protein
MRDAALYEEPTGEWESVDQIERVQIARSLQR